MTVIAEFRPLIEPANRGIVNLRKDSDKEVRWAGTVVLSKLCSQFIGLALLMEVTVGFQSSIGYS